MKVKVDRIEQLLPRPAPLEKPKEEEKVCIIKTIEFDDATYEGQVKDGLPHGMGTKKWKDGTTYEGNFAKGMMEGIGAWKKNGEEYKG